MIYRLNSLKRYNNIPRVKQESLAEHQYYTSIIIMKLLESTTLSTDLKYILLNYSLVHDVQELYTGDIPHNVKQDFPQFKLMLTEIENEWVEKTIFSNVVMSYHDELESHPYLESIFKLADLLQVMMYCEEEVKFGNKHTDIINIHEKAIMLCESIVMYLVDEKILHHEFNAGLFLRSVMKVMK